MTSYSWYGIYSWDLIQAKNQPSLHARVRFDWLFSDQSTNVIYIIIGKVALPCCQMAVVYLWMTMGKQSTCVRQMIKTTNTSTESKSITSWRLLKWRQIFVCLFIDTDLEKKKKKIEARWACMVWRDKYPDTCNILLLLRNQRIQQLCKPIPGESENTYSHFKFRLSSLYIWCNVALQNYSKCLRILKLRNSLFFLSHNKYLMSRVRGLWYSLIISHTMGLKIRSIFLRIMTAK